MILDLTNFYVINKKPVMMKLGGKVVEDMRYRFRGHICLDGQKFTSANGSGNSYFCGKHSVVLIPSTSKYVYKFFIFYTKADKKTVKAIHKIHNILGRHGLAPESEEILVVDIIQNEDMLRRKQNNEIEKKTRSRIPEGIGYGLKLRRLQPVELPDNKKETMSQKFLKRLRGVCKAHGLKRRMSLDNLMIEAKDPTNLIFCKDGCYLIDIDNRWSMDK
jgi:hypothetical protein